MAFSQPPAMPTRIGTGISKPQGYTPQQTQQFLNQQRADNAVAANSQFATKAFTAPGRGAGPGTKAMVAPRMAEYGAQQAAMGAAIPFADKTVNTGMERTYQQAQDQDGLGMIQAAGFGQQTSDQYANAMNQALLRMLSPYLVG